MNENQWTHTHMGLAFEWNWNFGRNGPPCVNGSKRNKSSDATPSGQIRINRWQHGWKSWRHSAALRFLISFNSIKFSLNFLADWLPEMNEMFKTRKTTKLKWSLWVLDWIFRWETSECGLHFHIFFPQENKLAALWRRRWNAALYLDDSGVLTRPTGRPPRADYSGVDACDLLSAPFLTCFSLSGPSDYVRCSMCCNFEFLHFFKKNCRLMLYEISCHVTRSHRWTSS